jgi:hypothetical protein
MSFPATTGILLPADVNIVHRIYSQIAAEPWFTSDPDRREQFALFVLDAYRRGYTQPSVLSSHCRDIALREFGNAASFIGSARHAHI